MTPTIAALAAALCASVVLPLVCVLFIVDVVVVVGKAIGAPLREVVLLVGVCGRRRSGRRSLGVHGRRVVCRLCADEHQWVVVRLEVSRWRVDGGHDIEQTVPPLRRGKDSGYIQMRSQETSRDLALGLLYTSTFTKNPKSLGRFGLPITRRRGRPSLLRVEEMLRPTRRESRHQSLPGRWKLDSLTSCSWPLAGDARC